jgi:hypothetical protein
MVKKAVKKKKVAKKKVVEEESVSKTVKSSEEKTLTWLVVIVGIVFAAVLVPYFFSESSKSFEFGGVDWVIEDYAEPVGEIFHGRFVSLTNDALNYNVFFRTDPRTNDAEVVGKLDDFWSHEVISWSPEVEACRGDLSRVMLDLGSFLKQGVGASVLDTGFTDEEAAKNTNSNFLTCHDAIERTVVIVEIGERGIVQSSVNPSCYTIYAEDCEDSGVVEKFMTQAVIDFRNKYG